MASVRLLAIPVIFLLNYSPGQAVLLAPMERLELNRLQDLRLPNPYTPEFLQELYTPWGLQLNGITLNHTKVNDAWSLLADRARELAEGEDGASGRAAFLHLLDDGLIVSRLGMDFTKVQQKRYGFPSPTGDELLTDSDVTLIRQVYFPSRVDDFFFNIDVPSNYRLTWPETMGPVMDGLSEKERTLISELRQDGVVQIDQFDDVTISDVEAEARPVLEGGQGGTVLEGGPPGQIHSVRAFLKPDSQVMKLMRAYLGAEATFHGMVTFRLNQAAYVNTPWHHDGCGKRLKLFLYLSDVDADTYPTVVARGTQRTQWFPPTQYFYGPGEGYNKLNDAVVDKEFGSRMKRMYGRIGGGFIFDTNALHGHDVPKQPKPRDVIIMEFSSGEHFNGVKEDKYREPSPQHGNAVAGFGGRCGGP